MPKYLKFEEKTERQKALDKAKRLLALSEGEVYSEDKNENEKMAASRQFERIILKHHFKTGELVRGIAISDEEVENARKLYGPFYEYVLFFQNWMILNNYRFKNPYNTLYEEEEMQESNLKDHRKLIADPNLEEFIKKVLGVKDDEELTVWHLRKLTILKAHNLEITDISGLEYAINLKTLDLSNNPIENFSPLEYMINLRSLNLSGTNIKSLNSLSRLKYLKILRLNNTSFKSLKPIVA